MNIQYLAWIYFALMSLSICSNILNIGKERSALTPGVVLINIIISLPVLYLFYLIATRGL